jgi:chorismate mutase
VNNLDISDWRDEIDRIDEELVKLLNKRSQCALEIGHIKHELNIPVYSPNREAEVIRHVTSINQGPLESGAIRRLFERIIDESRTLERITMEREKNEPQNLKAANAINPNEPEKQEG